MCFQNVVHFLEQLFLSLTMAFFSKCLWICTSPPAPSNCPFRWQTLWSAPVSRLGSQFFFAFAQTLLPKGPFSFSHYFSSPSCLHFFPRHFFLHFHYLFLPLCCTNLTFTINFIFFHLTFLSYYSLFFLLASWLS